MDGQRAARAVLRRLTQSYFHLEVTGLVHVPARGPAIIAANHPSVLDGILFFAVSPRPVRFLVTEEMFYHRLLHPLFEAFGCIPVYRTRAGNGDALRAAVAALERGEVIGIFPEGTTAFRGMMPQIRPGVALLALKTGAPIVPLALQGSAEAFPFECRLPRPKPIAMRFAPALSLPRCSDDPIPEPVLRRSLDQVRHRLLETLALTRPARRAGGLRAMVKAAQIAVASCVVCPLAGLLTITANPSLDPARGRA